ncbi:MAG TPA: aspartyl protease family protein [Terracidiphilus sp.]|nr:aspartyl protease family protein [Terracidiphilus sp.]
MRRLANPGSALATFLVASVLSLSAQDAVHSEPMTERFGKPYVMVTINGKGPYRFVIDTGTGGDAIVTPAVADELHLPTIGQARLNDPSGLGGAQSPVVFVESIKLAGVEFTEIRAIRHELTNEAGACQGLLGFTLFRSYLLTLDFPRRRVLLATGELKPDGGDAVLPFRMPQGVPITALEVAGHAVDAQLDSGGGGLTLPEALASQLKFDIDPVVFATGQSLSTRFAIKVAKLASDVKLGKYTFTHPVVEIHPAFRLVNFGSPPMENFTITFDQKNLLVHLAASHKRFTLTAPPTPTRLTNQPDREPPPNLLPVG